MDIMLAYDIRSIFVDSQGVGFFDSMIFPYQQKGEKIMLENSIIIKLEKPNEFTLGEITKITGHVMAKYVPAIINNLDLEANPRASRTGNVTDAIQDSIVNSPTLFPFKTKGILLAFSEYQYLDRGRIRLTADNPAVEGILDGGHNMLAIGLDILKKAMDHAEQKIPRGTKTWDQFKSIWDYNIDIINEYLSFIKQDKSVDELDYLIPIEIVVPRDPDDIVCVTKYKNDLFDICYARNNNAQLANSDKANHRGYFDNLKEYMEMRSKELSDRIIWKSNDGGDIKVQDLVSLSLIPLSLITPVKDDYGKEIEAISPNKLYSGKGSCLQQFERIMASKEVTFVDETDSKHKLINEEVKSALQIAVDLPELYDYIYENFPKRYNAAGGSYGRINAVKSMNEKATRKYTPYYNREIETLSPDGFIVPLVYGLKTLMTNTIVNGKNTVIWTQPPMPFLVKNLGKIVEQYSLVINMCDFDPQKVGKASQAYQMVTAAYKNVLNGAI